jgi:hypothetical protein
MISLNGSREHDRIQNGGAQKQFLYGWPNMINFGANAEELNTLGKIFVSRDRRQNERHYRGRQSRAHSACKAGMRKKPR